METINRKGRGQKCSNRQQHLIQQLKKYKFDLVAL